MKHKCTKECYDDGYEDGIDMAIYIVTDIMKEDITMTLRQFKNRLITHLVGAKLR